ncbi:M14 family metallopeptidase [Janthinobacterium sp.]|uniref:M14 family metallopeptidase n=1 Tax=Janthinobacterium sp. TaxID=1871054 RepID=UPI002617A84A|nr:M14 family metallopeptidase [Janthinobacterium sp.]
MIGVSEAFSTSYAKARVQFLEAAVIAGLQIESHSHPLAGAEDETLAMDVARDGAMDAEKLLIISSACHGIEGYCGSGVQVFALHDAEWLQKARDAGVAVLYVHALNPYGFSFGRRVTHENVDLNRNFIDFSQPLPTNPAYDEVQHLILPDTWPPKADVQKTIDDYIAQRGQKAWQAAVGQGQYQHPEGVFFGGQAPTWSNQTIRKVLRTHGAHARHIAWIDVHTGLGPNGYGERIFTGPNDAAMLARARRWWDGHGATPVTSLDDGSSSSPPLTGLLWNSALQECPLAQFTGIAMEYGTVPVLETTGAIRADHWVHNHPEAPGSQRELIHQRMRAAFYDDSDAWKGMIISQARQAMFQAVDGLCTDS